MTRQQFYNWIDSWTVTTSTTENYIYTVTNYFRTVHGSKLYQFSDVQGNINFPVEAVIHWGKIKCLEMAIFGSVGNGASLTSTSLFTSGTVRSQVPNFKVNDLNYLRYGLSRFNSYGSCHPESVIASAPVYLSETGRIFRFTLPSGILTGDCEVSIDGSQFSTSYLSTATTSGSTVSWPVPAGEYSIGSILIRVRKNRGAYIEASPSINNKILYT